MVEYAAKLTGNHRKKNEILGTAPSVHGPYLCCLVYGAAAASDAGV